MIRPPNRLRSLSLTLGKTSFFATVKASELYACPFALAFAYSSNSRMAVRNRAPCRPGFAIPPATTELYAFSYTRGTAERIVGEVSPALSTSLSTDSAKIIVSPLPNQAALTICAKECANGSQSRWLSSRVSSRVPTATSEAKSMLSFVIITPFGTPVVPEV